MTTFEDLFNKSALSVLAPESSVGFPKQDDPASWPEWLEKVETEDTDRKLAFFDEQLDFLLTLHFEQSSLTGDIDPQKPPVHLLSYLAHLQVSYEASYISSIASTPSGYTTELSRPPVPPRAHSLNTNVRASTASNKFSPLGLTVPGQHQHPSIFPPHTPHPIPSTAESDRQYVQAQGTPLRTGIWGEGSSTTETFALLWSKSRYAWVAVFRMSIQVAFLPTKMSDPLLCLTVSTTLRDKLVPVTHAREQLQALIEAAGEPASPSDPRSPVSPISKDDQDELGSLEDINLLEGLTIDPSFSSSESPLSLPSSRLGPSTRQRAFGLFTDPKAAITPQTVTPSTSRQSGLSHATLRKSFRKTLRTVSGFQIRMRTVFVPYFMLPQTAKMSEPRPSVPVGLDESDEELDPESLRERELIEHGADEHTVVLCVEVLNSGDSDAGFAIEGVNVTVSGDGANARLIGWGEAGLSRPDNVFPLLLAPREQYNLLYAVTFMRSPEMDEFSLAKGRGLPGSNALPELQRAVVIIINGRPYYLNEDETEDSRLNLTKLSYPTQTFPSRWNCVLDLSPQAPKAPAGQEQRTALPEPASPFPSAPTKGRPASASFAQNVPKLGANLTSPSVAGSKRHTFSAMDADAESPKYRGMLSPVNYRSVTSMLNPSNQRDPSAQTGSLPPSSTTPTPPPNPISSRASYAPPSVVAKAFGGIGSRTPTTTYGPLDPSLPSLPSVQRSRSYRHVADDSVGGQISLDGIPQTPAYPAFPMSPSPSTPHWQGPLASQQSGPIGPSVEIRREKGPNVAGVPPTPGPRVSAAGAFTQSDSFRDVVNADGQGEPIIVSVGLLWQDGGLAGRPGKIYPLDKFTLDIFVFNRSSWTRRFEVSYPDRREQRKEQKLLGGMAMENDGLASPGIIATENRVRIGPLLPSTCQSVRMDFLALTPGVHSVESLTLTDIQSGYVMHLRSVMDVIVHEHELTHPV
ncbi:TRAPP trafficking subunit Trs65-domain-containing protein [Irpex rosettiformis]|uniref:TRAPP trafficking subunit Trs65-domain-containing protein n=1 Tax=Irpex rosettiformis TaxID=378272 RepID=A0ACB8U1I5_9APHY|nr:TRAPP trafficking subunit Trs65-domain-containing protein [Irpex rosettiformis]